MSAVSYTHLDVYKRQLLGGVSPCKQSYDNYEIINNYPWLKLVKSCFGAARGRRMPPE